MAQPLRAVKDAPPLTGGSIRIPATSTVRYPGIVKTAPGLYNVIENDRPRYVRIHSVTTVKDEQQMDMHHSGVHVRSFRFHPFRPILLPDVRTVRAFLAQGFDKATDGCTVEPGEYCPHGQPGNALLWGLV